MRKTFATTVSVAVLVAVFVAGWAVAPSRAKKGGIKQYVAILNGGQQTPAVNTTAIGIAHFVFDPSNGSICMDMTSTGLSGPVTVVHIHRGGPNVDGASDIAVSYTGYDAVMNDNCGVGPGGPPSIARLSKSDIALLNKGQLYFNVHTEANPTGEIRGQILEAG